jgi:hypothetical protein
MTDKPKYLNWLILLWLLFAAIFFYLGYFSLTLALWIFSAEYTALGLPSWTTSMLFFWSFMATITLLVFGGIFVLFSYETYRLRTWVWNAGVIISTIFIVIFSFLLASLMITALLFKNEFAVQTLITIMLTFLVDLGIVFLITRPSIKAIFHP